MKFLTIFAWVMLIFNAVFGAYGVVVAPGDGWINLVIAFIWALMIRFVIPKR